VHSFARKKSAKKKKKKKKNMAEVLAFLGGVLPGEIRRGLPALRKLSQPQYRSVLAFAISQFQYIFFIVSPPTKKKKKKKKNFINNFSLP
jgi:hypothetical protein